MSSTTVPLALRQKAHPLRPGEFIWLYAIQTRVLSTAGSQAGINEWLLLTSRPDPVTFQSLVYTPYSIEHGDQEVDKEGNLPEVELKVANVQGLASQILRDYEGLDGMRVRITLVHKDHLLVPANAVVEEFDVMDASDDHDSKAVTIKLGQPRLNLARFPPFVFMRNGCRWRYKGDECGYVSHTTVVLGGQTVTVAADTCDLTLDGPNGCHIKQNDSRFGGFATIPEYL